MSSTACQHAPYWALVSISALQLVDFADRSRLSVHFALGRSLYESPLKGSSTDDLEFLVFVEVEQVNLAKGIEIVARTRQDSIH